MCVWGGATTSADMRGRAGRKWLAGDVFRRLHGTCHPHWRTQCRAWMALALTKHLGGLSRSCVGPVCLPRRMLTVWRGLAGAVDVLWRATTWLQTVSGRRGALLMAGRAGCVCV